MRRIIVAFLLIGCVLGGPSGLSGAIAQRGHPPAAGRAVQRQHPPVRRSAVVFIGGYFYDPFFGPYPWWPRRAYPYPYYPVYDDRAVIRVLATPPQAAVYVDGFYAGIVDDFNSWFQGLGVPPGGHEVVLYLDGYRTVRHRIYVAPGSTIKLHDAMQPVRPGEVSERPMTAPPAPQPPDGTYLPPRTPPRVPPAPVPLPYEEPEPEAADLGTLSLRVQPVGADVRIDGERWMSSDGGRFVIELAPGRHRVVVTASGFRPFTADLDITAAETVPLIVTLLRERTPDAPARRDPSR